MKNDIYKEYIGVLLADGGQGRRETFRRGRHNDEAITISSKLIMWVVQGFALRLDS